LTDRSSHSPYGTGQYNLGLDCLQPLGPVDATLQCGGIVSEKIETLGDADFITFEGQTGAQVSLTLIRTSGFYPDIGIVPTLTVFAPSGAVVGAFDWNDRKDFGLQETGTYAVPVNARSLTDRSSHSPYGTGQYNLGLDCLQPLGPVDATLQCGG